MTIDAERACASAELIIGAKRLTGSLARFGKETANAVLPAEISRIIRESGGRYLNRRKPAPPVSRLSPPLAFFLGAGASSVLIGGAALIAVLL